MNTDVICAVAGCGHSPFPVNAAFDARARRTGERFYCPAGHVLFYPKGKTDEQKAHEKAIRQLKESVEWFSNYASDMSAVSRQCPWPTCRSYVYSSRYSMFEHMRRLHGMPSVSEIEVDETTVNAP